MSLFYKTHVKIRAFFIYTFKSKSVVLRSFFNLVFYNPYVNIQQEIKVSIRQDLLYKTIFKLSSVDIISYGFYFTNVNSTLLKCPYIYDYMPIHSLDIPTSAIGTWCTKNKSHPIIGYRVDMILTPTFIKKRKQWNNIRSHLDSPYGDIIKRQYIYSI